MRKHKIHWHFLSFTKIGKARLFEVLRVRQQAIHAPYTIPWLLMTGVTWNQCIIWHDDVIKWKHFPRCWPFARGIHRSPTNSPHKGQWRGALMFSLICVWINDWVNNGEAGDLRRYRIHYDVTVMRKYVTIHQQSMKCIYKRSKILKYLKIKKMHECLKTQQPHWQTGPGHFNIRCLKSKREDASFRWEGREFQILAAWYVKVLGKDETRNIQAVDLVYLLLEIWR